MMICKFTIPLRIDCQLVFYFTSDKLNYSHCLLYFVSPREVPQPCGSIRQVSKSVSRAQMLQLGMCNTLVTTAMVFSFETLPKKVVTMRYLVQPSQYFPYDLSQPAIIITPISRNYRLKRGLNIQHW